MPVLLEDGGAWLKTDAGVGGNVVLSRPKGKRRVFEIKIGNSRRSQVWPSAGRLGR